MKRYKEAQQSICGLLDVMDASKMAAKSEGRTYGERECAEKMLELIELSNWMNDDLKRRILKETS